MKSCLILEVVDEGWDQLSHMQLLCRAGVIQFLQVKVYQTTLPREERQTKMIINFTFILYTRVVYQVESFDCLIQM